MAGIFGFGNKQPQQRQQQQQQQTQQQQQQVPVQQQQQQQQNQAPDYSNFWAPAEQTGGLKAPVPAFKLEDAQSIAKGYNFVNMQIPDQVKQQLQNGDFTPLLQLINNVAQRAVAQAVTDSAAVTSGAFNNHFGQLDGYIGEAVSGQNLRSGVMQQYEKLAKDPRFAPMLEGVVNQMRSKNPNASESELKQQVVSFVNDFVTSAGGKLETPVDSAAQQEDALVSIGVDPSSGQVDDWGAFMDMTPPGQVSGFDQAGGSTTSQPAGAAQPAQAGMSF